MAITNAATGTAIPRPFTTVAAGPTGPIDTITPTLAERGTMRHGSTVAHDTNALLPSGVSLKHGLRRFEHHCRANSAAYVAQAHAEAGRCHSDGNPPRTHTPADVLAGREFEAAPAEPVTVFHTRGFVAMPLADLAVRMVRRLQCSYEDVAIALVLCARYAAKKQPVTWHMLHRLFVTALHVGLKAHSDRFFTLSAFATAAGVHQQEMRRLESHFVRDIQFRCVVLLPPDAAPSVAAHVLDAVTLVAMAELNFARTAYIYAPDSPQEDADSFDAAVTCLARSQSGLLGAVARPPAVSPSSFMTGRNELCATAGSFCGAASENGSFYIANDAAASGTEYPPKHEVVAP